MKNYLLKSERAKRNLTQKDMAKLLGLKTFQSYTLKENGQRQFTVKEIEIISKKWKLSGKEIKEIFFDNYINTKGK